MGRILAWAGSAGAEQSAASCPFVLGLGFPSRLCPRCNGQFGELMNPLGCARWSSGRKDVPCASQAGEHSPTASAAGRNARGAGLLITLLSAASTMFLQGSAGAQTPLRGCLVISFGPEEVFIAYGSSLPQRRVRITHALRVFWYVLELCPQSLFAEIAPGPTVSSSPGPVLRRKPAP